MDDKQVVLHIDDGKEAITDPESYEEAHARAKDMAQCGITVLSVVSEEYGKKRLAMGSPHFVRYHFAGEQKESETFDSWARAREHADSVEYADIHNTDIEVLPAVLRSPWAKAVSGDFQEPAPEQHDAIEQTLREATPQGLRDRAQALEYALRLHSANAQVLVLPVATKDLLASAELFLAFLHPGQE